MRFKVAYNKLNKPQLIEFEGSFKELGILTSNGITMGDK